MLGDADCALRGRDQCKITASAHGSLHVRIMHTGGFCSSKTKAYRTHLRLGFLAARARQAGSPDAAQNEVVDV